METNYFIHQLNLVRNTRFEEIGDVKVGYVSEYRDKETNISICFNKYFPFQIPDFYVNTLGEVCPHIEKNGKICLFDTSSVLFDYRNPEALLVNCYDQAISVIGVDKNTSFYHKEIVREYDAYWRQVSQGDITSLIDLRRITFDVFKMIAAVSGKRFFVADSEEKTRMLFERFMSANTDSVEILNCVFIKLKQNCSFLPLKDEYGWNELRQYILKNTSKGIRQRFKAYTEKELIAIIESFVLVLPTEFGNVAMGFVLCGRANKLVKMCYMLGTRCVPIRVRRIDYSYLVNRAGAMSGLEKKRVLLLGCGSVGSYVAEDLCKIGIKTLDILDKEALSEENVYRHYLGFDSLNNKSGITNKADLMKDRLENEFLDIDIDSLDFRERDIESLLQEKRRLANYDLVVSALGEPMLNLRINRALQEEHISTPFICAFNEPYGIGGHAVLTNCGDEGCLECLYTDIDSSEYRENRISLVEPGQSFKKNVSGCGGAFVPYSALDSQQTAIIVVRLAASVLLGNERDNCIVSWLGDDESLTSNGYRPSEYYYRLKGNREEKTLLKANCFCEVCRMKTKG